MDKFALDAIIALIAGLIGGLIAEGVRRMFAPKVLPSKVRLGKLTLKEDKAWCIQVFMNANTWWNILAYRLEDVKAHILFVGRNTNSQTERLATWWRPDIDAPSINLRVGGEDELRVATINSGTLKMIDSIEQKDDLVGDFDIKVTLHSSSQIIGIWSYPGAVIQGVMQEIEPKRCKREGK